jgi:hypothetical protein
VNRHDASRLAVGLRTALKLVAACAPPSAPKRDPRSLCLTEVAQHAAQRGLLRRLQLRRHDAGSSGDEQRERNQHCRTREACVRERTKEEKLEFGPQL